MESTNLDASFPGSFTAPDGKPTVLSAGSPPTVGTSHTEYFGLNFLDTSSTALNSAHSSPPSPPQFPSSTVSTISLKSKFSTQLESSLLGVSHGSSSLSDSPIQLNSAPVRPIDPFQLQALANEPQSVPLTQTLLKLRSITSGQPLRTISTVCRTLAARWSPGHPGSSGDERRGVIVAALSHNWPPEHAAFLLRYVAAPCPRRETSALRPDFAQLAKEEADNMATASYISGWAASLPPHRIQSILAHIPLEYCVAPLAAGGSGEVSQSDASVGGESIVIRISTASRERAVAQAVARDRFSAAVPGGLPSGNLESALALAGLDAADSASFAASSVARGYSRASPALPPILLLPDETASNSERTNVYGGGGGGGICEAHHHGPVRTWNRHPAPSVSAPYSIASRRSSTPASESTSGSPRTESRRGLTPPLASSSSSSSSLSGMRPRLPSPLIPGSSLTVPVLVPPANLEGTGSPSRETAQSDSATSSSICAYPSFVPLYQEQPDLLLPPTLPSVGLPPSAALPTVPQLIEERLTAQVQSIDVSPSSSLMRPKPAPTSGYVSLLDDFMGR